MDKQSGSDTEQPRKEPPVKHFFQSIPGQLVMVGATVLVTLIVTNYWDTFQTGDNALIERIAERVYDEKAKLPGGKSHAQAIDENTKALIELTTVIRMQQESQKALNR